MDVIRSIIFLLLVSLASCSCEYHLSKAYKKKCLEQTTYTDTTTVYDTVVTDTTVFFNVPRDSVRYVDSVKCVDGVPTLISGSKSSERASVSVELKDGVLSVNAYCEALEDSVRVLQQRIIEGERIINVNNEMSSKLEDALKEQAEASKRKSFYLILFGIAACLFGLVFLVNKFT